MAMSQPKEINAFTIGNITYLVDVALSKDAIIHLKVLYPFNES
jgi:hypothetical protein